MSPTSCPSDDTVTIFDNAKESRSTFKFHSFRFQRLDKSSTVWLHCEVQVCDSDRLPCRPVSLRPLYTELLLLVSKVSRIFVGQIVLTAVLEVASEGDESILSTLSSS